MTPFLPFSWKEFLDLLLISFLLHRLYLLFRGTTALQVAIGVFSLWVLYFAADRAGLVVTTRFFQAMAAVGAVGLIVVFRREIREILLHTNPLRFFLGQSSTPVNVDFNETAAAVFRLAEKRIGGLVCFQRRDNIEEFVGEGTRLDGRLGGAILESIFAKESPLHDGAVIVRHGRITRIGGFLPLTHEKNVPEQLGTRHRAALGLSECCDALILVVSEERGEVSLVEGGKMEMIESPQMLRRRLAAVGKRPVANGIRASQAWEWVRQAGGLGLVFLMVMVLWNLYLGTGDSLTSMQVAVELRNVPENTEVTHDFEKNFGIRIVGKNPLIEALQPGQVSAFIDLEGLGMGTHSLAVGPDNIRLPPGLRLEQVEPETVEIRMEPRIERDLPVRVVFSGHRADGIAVGALAPEPAIVRVVGPQSRLERMTHLPTEPVRIDELVVAERQEVSAALAPLPPSISFTEGAEREVEIPIEMRQ